MSAKVLLVDDNVGELQLLEMVLHPLGLETFTADNGLAALQQARAIIPDLILLDVMLPGMDGFHVCSELRADAVLAEVPIILITAMDEKSAFLQGMNAGADDFITKPFDPLLLRSRVQTITRLNRYRGLRQERSKFHWVVEYSDEGYVILSEDQHLVYANPRAQEMIGWSSSGEEESRTDLSLFREVVVKRFQLYPDSYWNTWPHVDGQRGPGYLVQPEQAGVAAIWIQVDMLEIPPREGEHYFLRLRDVTSAIHENRLMWSFQDIISHKFQTPLSLIEGFLETLHEFEFEREQREMLLDTALVNVRRLQHEISSLFRYLGATELVSQGSTITTIDQLIAIFTRVRTDLEIAQFTLHNLLPQSTEPTAVSLTNQAIEGIFRELLQNAVKFHPQRNPVITLTIEQVDQMIRLQLADDGPGLPAIQAERIWVPYYQAEEHFYGETPGLGLGLATVAVMVVSAGGRCRSRSHTDDGGLIIELDLPISGPEAELA